MPQPWPGLTGTTPNVVGMDDLTCPGCGEDDNLSGRRDGDPGQPGAKSITVTCGSCELSWVRDLAPRCPTCGTDEVRTALQSIVEKSRGTQLSIQSMRVVYLCPTCDPERLADWNQTNSPMRPAELPHDVD